MDYQDALDRLEMSKLTRDWIIFQSLKCTVALKDIPEEDLAKREPFYLKLKNLHTRLEYEMKLLKTLLDELNGGEDLGH